MKNLLVFLTAVLVAIAGIPEKAMAAYQKRIHGSGCYMQNNLNASFYDETRGLLNNTANNQIFTCPYESDTDLAFPAVTICNVHGQKNSAAGTDFAWAQAKFWGIYGFDNGISASTGVSGPWTMGPNLSKWQFNSGADFAYVKVQLNPQSGIFGLFIAN